MLTLGVDLGPRPQRTAACLVKWGEYSAEVVDLVTSIDHEVIFEMSAHCTKVGVDAPFGWPIAFGQLVGAHMQFESWPWSDPEDQMDTWDAQPWGMSPPWAHASGSPLRSRFADRIVGKVLGTAPRSGSTDRLSNVTVRCAQLQAMFLEAGLEVDRLGTGILVEVYPEGALRKWGLELPTSYKGSGAVGLRRRILGAVVSEIDKSHPLHISDEFRDLCGKNETALEAFISTLVARLAALNATEDWPEGVDVEILMREGWTHLPPESGLQRLWVGTGHTS